MLGETLKTLLGCQLLGVTNTRQQAPEWSARRVSTRANDFHELASHGGELPERGSSLGGSRGRDPTHTFTCEFRVEGIKLIIESSDYLAGAARATQTSSRISSSLGN